MGDTLYKITQNEKFGRYIVASKNIKQGQLIFKENPVILCPQIGLGTICFNCCAEIQKLYFCPECSTAALCTPSCKGRFHTHPECSFLKTQPIKREDIITNPEIVTTLRVLLWRQYDKNLFERFLHLENHLQQRRDTLIWRRIRANIQDVLYKLKMIDDDDVGDELVQKICAVLDINTFEVRQPQRRGDMLRGLFMEAAMMAHDCVANVHLAVDDDFTLFVRAAVDIPEECPIFFNYTNVLLGNEERRRQLREGKCFECTCSRCSDPTEFGTEMSTIKCPRCHKGLLRPKSWQCSSCQHYYHDGLIKTALHECRSRIDEMVPNIDNLERFLKKLSFTFHPHHHLVLEVEQNLVRLYTQGVPLVKHLRRKIELCHKLLAIFRKIEPGISRIEAIASYELHSAIVALAQKLHHNKEIDREEFLKMLVLAEDTLKNSVKFLLYEPLNSPEGRLAQNALSELKMLRASINSLQPDATKKQNKKK